jgi:ADP-ribose pyrophosphatase YjhB (NUDIX family)
MIVRPSLGVSVGVWRGDKVLLVRRGTQPLKGAWTFPGGRVEWGETSTAAAQREVLEETGLQVSALSFLYPLDFIGPLDSAGRARWHTLLLVYACRSEDGVPIAGDDAEAAAFFAPDQLDGMELTPGLMHHIEASRAVLSS